MDFPRNWFKANLYHTLARLSTMLLAVLFAAMATRAFAQQLEPRRYTNTPVGMNFLIAGYGYATGSVLTDPSSPLQNANVQTHEMVIAYARSLDVWGKSGKFDIILPYAWTSGSAEIGGETRERDVSGLGDPRLRFSVNLYGAPAISIKEFADYQQDVIFGASLQVTPPLGQYDTDRLLNIGTNRWTIKPELGVSKTIGPLILEFAAGAAFYTDNHEFLGDRTRTQDPIYSVQSHVIYSMHSGIWAALDGTYYTGGNTAIDGVKGSDRQNNSRVGLTVALPVNRHNSLKLFGSTGVSTRANGDFNAVGIAWQCRWGGGL